ncbi:hypothetical protein EVAR_29028_1 [Eumeta japonica]|uniref:Uncharacterized protein n=1 Tax=Eumeta variegata TaxID=151549 RepID=A0A4C1W342_EUMVA|nr:hypothetical protein EVAR_29028_1 [Eumeta japonica]
MQQLAVEPCPLLSGERFFDDSRAKPLIALDAVQASLSGTRTATNCPDNNNFTFVLGASATGPNINPAKCLQLDFHRRAARTSRTPFR